MLGVFVNATACCSLRIVATLQLASFGVKTDLGIAGCMPILEVLFWNQLQLSMAAVACMNSVDMQFYCFAFLGTLVSLRA